MLRARLSILSLLLAVAGTAQVVVYEGDVLPETVGWERVGTFDADRSIDHGWLVQFVQLGVWAPEPLGQADFYRRSLKGFAGVPAFFIEWRVETDAPSSILDVSGTPVALAAGGSAAANYHMTITDEKVQLWRSNFLPILLVDITPGVPHTFRVELHGDTSYAWYIDGELVDSGTPEGPYPNTDSVVIWGAQHHYVDNTTRWEYVRFGVIPNEGSGDFDSDAAVANNDYALFHECLTNERPGINGGPGYDAGQGCRFADFDLDNDVDLFDFAEFQVSFTGGK